MRERKVTLVLIFINYLTALLKPYHKKNPALASHR